MVLAAQRPVEARPLELRDLPIPEPRPEEVGIRVLCCGICRTDLHVIEGDLAPHRLPLVPGHQVVGVVDALGEGCSAGLLGARVGIAWLRHTCGACGFCRAGMENLCAASQYTGYDADGGFAEYAVAPAAYVYPLPEVFNPADAAPLLCAGIIGYRALKRSQLPKGGTLAIYGFGSSAHIVCQIARHRGCRVFVVTRGASHRQLARDMGAAWAGEDAADMPEPADSAIIFAPAGELVPPALEHLKKGGTLALAGIHMSEVPALNYERHLFYERNVCSVTANTRADGCELFAEAAAIPIRPRTTTFSLEQANEALIRLKHDEIDGSGVLSIS